MNIYKDKIISCLPRILGSFNFDETDDKYGVGDRKYVFWKLSDFANGSYQGLVLGLTIIYKMRFFPNYISKKKLLSRIKIIAFGTENILRNNGSLEESFPFESSYCVTAQVLADLLYSYELISNNLTKEEKKRWIDMCSKMKSFLLIHDETHGEISNHIACALLALTRWNNLRKEKVVREKIGKLREKLLSFQDSEGWFKEYNGADPGYQSLCLSYLTQINNVINHDKTFNQINKSINFLKYAFHPDGSFGGIYGSRNTRFLYPSSFEILTKKNILASKMSSFVRNGIIHQNFVTLDSINDENLVPMFNDYAIAAMEFERNKKLKPKAVKLPFEENNLNIYLKNLGWFIRSNKREYTVINYSSGGSFIHFRNKIKYENPGIIFKMKDKIMISTPNKIINPINFDSKELITDYNMSILKKPRPTASTTIILRFVSLLFLKNLTLNKIVKKFLSNYLLNSNKSTKIKARRIFKIGKSFSYLDFLPNETTPVKYNQHFTYRHMASQGYWQLSDENDSKI